MIWTPEAEKAIKKVPFFVRKKVRLRVENEAKAKGKNRITLDDVKATKAAYLSNMSAEVKGYQVDACFGSEGCPNRATNSDLLIEKIEEIFSNVDLLGFIKERVAGDLKPHHEFRVTVADCPNACSQPQIKDIGIIGACTPEVTEKECSLCNLCVDICREEAVSIDDDVHKPIIDFALCLKCGQCMDVCPTGTLLKGKTGFRVQLGGKLGRHPRLARELPGIYADDQVLEIVNACIKFYKENSSHGERFSEIFKTADFEGLLSHATPISPRRDDSNLPHSGSKP